MNAEEREKLKDQVMDMVLTGYTHRQICKRLNIALRSVVSYVHDRKQESLKEIHQTADIQIAEMTLAKNKRTQKLWTMVLDESVKDSDRNKAIQLLQQEEIMDIRRKQIIGMLPAEAPMVAIQNNNVIEGVTTIADSIRRFHPELAEKFRLNKSIDVESQEVKDGE